PPHGAMNALGHAFRHEPMIGGVKLDDVAPKPLGVEGPELGDVFVGEPRLLDYLRRAPALAEGGERRSIGTGTVRGHGVPERLVLAIEINVLIGRRLVE